LKKPQALRLRKHLDRSNRGDVKQTWADVGKAAKLLGYSTDFDLEKGLSTITQWYEKSIKHV